MPHGYPENGSPVSSGAALPPPPLSGVYRAQCVLRGGVAAAQSPLDALRAEIGLLAPTKAGSPALVSESPRRPTPCRWRHGPEPSTGDYSTFYHYYYYFDLRKEWQVDVTGRIKTDVAAPGSHVAHLDGPALTLFGRFRHLRIQGRAPHRCFASTARIIVRECG